MTWTMATVLISFFIVFGTVVVLVAKIVAGTPGSGVDVSLALNALAEPFRALADMFSMFAALFHNLRK